MQLNIGFYNIIKRVFDVSLALIALGILLPLMVVLAVLIFLKVDRQVFFVQTRVGKKHKLFKIYKFKTMSNKRDANGELLPDNDRLTPYGKIIRSLSLDELPQLLNVLRGELSFVGPRPLLVEYIPLYSKYQDRRHEVKPGITGWAQINGRNSISWAQKFDYDVWYVNNKSFGLDLKIICLTFYKVLSRHGVSQSNLITMERFTGNN